MTTANRCQCICKCGREALGEFWDWCKVCWQLSFSGNPDHGPKETGHD